MGSDLRSTSPAVHEVREQVERILRSQALSGSDTPRNLLRFLAEHTVGSSKPAPKEHEIATALLGRPVDFDPKVDPVVRVNATRLRSKLAEYYVAEGAEDPVYIEVPRGSYCLAASYRHHQPEERPALSRRAKWWWICAPAAALLLLAGWAYRTLSLSGPEAALKRLWAPLLASPKTPLVVFSNPRFVGSSTTGLRLFDPARDQAEVINGGYTGTGEVNAVHELTQLFSRFGRTIRPKRSQLFTWDDAKAYNLIFVGAAPHNVSLFRLSIGRHFRFKPYEEEPYRYQGCVQNLQPRAGEQAYYCASTEGPTSLEYALATFTWGGEEDQAVFVLAGTTTNGTQAAVEFFCDGGRAAQVPRALGLGPRAPVPPFEAMLRCKVRGGAPVGSELVLVKK